MFNLFKNFDVSNNLIKFAKYNIFLVNDYYINTELMSEKRIFPYLSLN